MKITHEMGQITQTFQKGAKASPQIPDAFMEQVRVTFEMSWSMDATEQVQKWVGAASFDEIADLVDMDPKAVSAMTGEELVYVVIRHYGPEVWIEDWNLQPENKFEVNITKVEPNDSITNEHPSP